MAWWEQLNIELSKYGRFCKLYEYIPVYDRTWILLELKYSGLWDDLISRGTKVLDIFWYYMQETNRFIRKFTYLEVNILTAYYMCIFMILLTSNIRLNNNDICVKKCNWIVFIICFYYLFFWIVFIIFLILQSSDCLFQINTNLTQVLHSWKRVVVCGESIYLTK